MILRDNQVKILWIIITGILCSLVCACNQSDLTLIEQNGKWGYINSKKDIVIPPNSTYMTQGFHSFDHPVRIDSWQPHGHLRMNAASLEILAGLPLFTATLCVFLQKGHVTKSTD